MLTLRPASAKVENLLSTSTDVRKQIYDLKEIVTRFARDAKRVYRDEQTPEPYTLLHLMGMMDLDDFP